MTPARIPERKLTDKQAQFARIYATNGGNGVQAYRDAGYSVENMSVETVGSAASALLAHYAVSERIQWIQHLKDERALVTADRVMAELSKLAFSDVTRIFDDQGRLKPVAQLDPYTAAAISSIEVETAKDGETKVSRVKFHPKLEALNGIVKILGIAPDKLDITLNWDGNPETLPPATRARMLEHLRMKALESLGGDESKLAGLEQEQRAEVKVIDAECEESPEGPPPDVES